MHIYRMMATMVKQINISIIPHSYLLSQLYCNICYNISICKNPDNMCYG